MVALLMAWYLVGLYLQHRLLVVICPKCKQRALAHGFFFMRDAKCQHCGFAYRSGAEVAEDRPLS